MAFDGSTIHGLDHELNQTLLNRKISKIAQPEKEELLITVKGEKGTYRLLISANASLPLIYLSSENKPSPITAPNFCMVLRKYIGNGKMVKASINELGGVTGGKTGDQTGREIYIGNYYKPSYGWDYVLRYYGGEEGEKPKAGPVSLPCFVKLPMLQRGDKGEYVKALQILLIGRGFGCGPDGADGNFGPATERAVQAFQADHNLYADGVVGNLTWAKLMGQ